MQAYSRMICSGCGGDINKGESFIWGARRGDKLCTGCFAPVAVPAIDDSTSNWSEYQKAFFNAVREWDSNIIVQGVAGCGKSTSILRASQEVPNLEVAYVVYNKANAKEAKDKFAKPAPHVNCTTFHAAGYAALRRRLDCPSGQDPMDGGKINRLLQGMIGYGEGTMTQGEYDAFGSDIAKLVGLAKNHGVGAGLRVDEYETWVDLVAHYGVTFDMPEDVVNRSHYDPQDRGIKLARQVLAQSNSSTMTIDFDDQLYLAVKLGVTMQQYDLVFVDEVQDVNPTRRALLRMMVKPNGGRVVAVGDSRQSCYGFTGAEADSMEKIQQDWNAVEMPLSINYRCSTSVLDLARKYCPTIEARPDAPVGSVETVNQMKLVDFLPTDAVLCRLNAPLISLAYRFIGAGIPVKVAGRDIGQNLVSHAKKLKGKGRKHVSLDELLERNDAYKRREIAKHLAKGADDKAQSVSDKCDSLAAAVDGLSEDEYTVEGLIARLTNLFSLNMTQKEADAKEKSLPPRTLLSSVHRSKGMEWDRVFVLDPSLMPSKWARQAWMQVQEQNLIYISITRARQDLRYINSEQIV